jgi:hypothetical protein
LAAICTRTVPLRELWARNVLSLGTHVRGESILAT